VHIGPLERAHLDDARALLAAALPHDRVAIVAEEKLFGSNGARAGTAWGAFKGTRLDGVLATAGRWIKLLAVDEARRGHGLGTALVERARDAAGGGKLRVADHPGNYLSPGLDVRYQAGRAFFERRGFCAVGEVENIRAAVVGNAQVSAERAGELAARAAEQGYTIVRGSAEQVNRESLLEWIGRAFAPVWANEARRALDGPRVALHVALHKNSPVAFAAADGNNQGLGWFGPAGTDPAHRGRGLGEALLIACLVDVRGLDEAGVIAWIGPKEFYRKACGAGDDRRFVQLEVA
jgi:GNAT superfamily N-acetyltransferase